MCTNLSSCNIGYQYFPFLYWRMYCSWEGNGHAVCILKVSSGLVVVDRAESIPSFCAQCTLSGCGGLSPRTFCGITTACFGVDFTRTMCLSSFSVSSIPPAKRKSEGGPPCYSMPLGAHSGVLCLRV